MPFIYKDFVNREKQLKDLRDVAQNVDVRLVLIDGRKGIGKTSLLKEFHASNPGLGISSVYYDLEDRPAEHGYMAIVQAIKNQLEGRGLDVRELEHAVQQTNEDLSTGEINRQQIEQVLKTVRVSQSEQSHLREMPGHQEGGVVFERDATITESKFAARDFYNLEIKLPGETKEVQKSIKANVTRSLKETLKPFTAEHNTVFIFDHWEESNDDTRGWIRTESLMQWILYQTLPKAILVAASDKKPVWYEDRSGYKLVEVPDLPPEAVQFYWAEKKLPLEELPESPTYRYPPLLVLAALIASLQHKPVGKPIEQALGQTVERLLSTLPDHIAYIIRIGAIPHWVDEALLRRLAEDDEHIGEALTMMREIQFARQDEERYRYHSVMRDYLLNWWRERPREYLEKNQIAQDYFQSLAQAAPFAKRPFFQREVLYHLILIDEYKGSNSSLKYLAERFEEANDRYQLGTAEDYVTHLREHATHLTESGRAWLKYYLARLDLIFRRNGSGEAEFISLSKRTIDPILQGLAMWHLGEIRLRQNEWKGSIDYLNDSLKHLEGADADLYTARVMLTIGDAYLAMADNSGGILQGRDEHYGALNRLLHYIQHLPFLVYEWLLHRVSFLPNMWYFGTNYQDWIVAYLLIKTSRWYRKSEQLFKKLGEGRGMVEAQISKANVEYQMGRWSRAEKNFMQLLDKNEVINSRYRTAKVFAGLGGIYLAEGKLSNAAVVLSGAAGTFRVFQDYKWLGRATAQLGRVYARLEHWQQAGTTYAESIKAYESIEDRLSQTQVVWDLENLSSNDLISNAQRQTIRQVVETLEERQYITRFPDKLLMRFRQLASLVALPISYALTFIVGVALISSLAIVEAGIGFSIHEANLQTISLYDALILLLGIVLPFPLALWLFRLVYSLMGMVVVQILGRGLIRIEKEQPEIIITNAAGITIRKQRKEERHSLAWADVDGMASNDTCIWQRPIHLVSRIFLTTESQPTILEGVTFGYEHLKGNISRHLKRAYKHHNLDLPILSHWSILVALIFSIVYSILVVFIGERIVWTVELANGEGVILVLSPILLVSLFTVFFVYPPTIFWRMIGLRRIMRKILGHRSRVAPNWILWPVTIFSSFLAILWIFLAWTLQLE